MKITLYHLYRRLDHNMLAYPIVLEVLRSWAESIGWKASVSICTESKVKIANSAEVVGISVYTQTAQAAYRLSDKLRRRGKIVILGGPHFRIPRTQSEAISHCDVLVHSICKEQWIEVLRAVEKGQIQAGNPGTVFIIDKDNSFRYPENFYGHNQSKKWYQFPSVPTSLGCPFDCSFCSPYAQGAYFLRDIKTIFNEVSRIKERVIFICDASFGMNKKFTKELMHTLAPLKKKFVVEITLSRLMDEDILDALAFGGVKRVMAGIETFALKLKKHGSGDIERNIEGIIENVQKRGMQMQGNIICGLDCDGPDSFEHIYDFSQKTKMNSILVNLLTPYPTTKLFEQMQAEGRIFDTNWEHYDYHHLVYHPKNMTENQLIDGYLELYRSVSNGAFVLKDAIKEYRDNGFNVETTALLSYNVYAALDALRKVKELRRNQDQIQMNAETA
jgi:radical SAM superfamily enzyme YgiQ (UPF0313 family)